MSNGNTFDNYAAAAMRTAKVFEEKKFSPKEMDLIHAALGVASDAGELVDAIKKYVIYGKELDVNNVIEEIGDVLWFLALCCEAIGENFDFIAQMNIVKLMKRYPEKYSDEAAIVRADKNGA